MTRWVWAEGPHSVLFHRSGEKRSRGLDPSQVRGWRGDDAPESLLPQNHWSLGCPQ